MRRRPDGRQRKLYAQHTKHNDSGDDCIEFGFRLADTIEKIQRQQDEYTNNKRTEPHDACPRPMLHQEHGGKHV